MNNHSIFNNFRFKLAITYAGVMGSTLLLCGYVAHIVMIQAFTRTVDRELQILGKVFEDKLKKELKIPGELSITTQKSLPGICFKQQTCLPIKSESEVMNLLSESYYVRLLTLKGEAIAAIDNNSDEFPPNINLNHSYDIKNRHGELYHLHLMPLKINNNQLWGYLQVGRSVQRLNDYMNSLHWLLGLGIPSSMMIIGGAGWWLAGLAMRPIQTSYQQLQKFTADAAHELRTPITSLKTIVETNSINQETQKALERQIKRLVTLTQDLLLLSRLESGLNEAKWQQICLNDLVADVEEELMPMAMNAEVLLSSDIPDEVYFYIQGIETQIYRMLLNLVSNAIKYTPVGKEVKIYLIANDNQSLITIKDTGIGIPAADIPYIFDRFYRVNADRSRNTGGSGLGLAIALAIVQTHQGKLEVESHVDNGSTFTVILPLVSKVNR
ncbi:two-component sensor histidine kinase [Anabaena cylindrica FACHB-243]|uniref:histidine kinase n=1 Tax=Anabaena cylindrica (strain ATCC 27899 / PCC 7122) TaxID=272123 RepID=K9ZGK5_ANACC|nr:MULTISPECIES: two-component system sensor histidine kinase RppB [Anabaena]AFZ58311.1 integral membrane sensor signal transduction histidine kinase [Anabaena cylindrica PCC 7122]MBD2416903.1 two-component sensor histidine kinase [Anabaena cylindrica FACHB-243]MBY5281914.1 two-component sensor histidine kinase [Anabaena sp. CCAP 1446/1C]MBY5308610.1 two-component sensor histidine kinase [Anabaena sp. CCAP 1446/1C]MCM2406435.1 HAMP domain-containing histidine kinase [Anabaena sp. CCAP 1446/1C]